MTVLWQSICTFWLCNLFSTSSSSAIQFTKLIHSKGRKRLRKILRYCLTFLSISVSQVSQSASQWIGGGGDAHIPTHKYAHSPSVIPSPVTSPAAIHSHPMIMMMTRDATTTLTTTTTKTKKMINICHTAALLMCWPSLPIPIPIPSIHPSNEWWAVRWTPSADKSDSPSPFSQSPQSRSTNCLFMN